MKGKQDKMGCEICGHHLISIMEVQKRELEGKKEEKEGRKGRRERGEGKRGGERGRFTILWIKIFRGNRNANTCMYNNNNKSCKSCKREPWANQKAAGLIPVVGLIPS